MYKEKASYGISKENCSISIYGILDFAKLIIVWCLYISDEVGCWAVFGGLFVVCRSRVQLVWSE
jgi:hypothetical protein